MSSAANENQQSPWVTSNLGSDSDQTTPPSGGGENELKPPAGYNLNLLSPRRLAGSVSSVSGFATPLTSRRLFDKFRKNKNENQQNNNSNQNDNNAQTPSTSSNSAQDDANRPPQIVLNSGGDGEQTSSAGRSVLDPKAILELRIQKEREQVELLKSARHREEQKILSNIRRRIAVSRMLGHEGSNNMFGERKEEMHSAEETALANKRNLLFRKIMSNRTLQKISNTETLEETRWQDSEFITECLTWHNYYRQRHGAPPLVLASQLCSLAQSWANHLAHTNTFYYRNDAELGENIFCRITGPSITEVSGKEVVAYWYTAVRQYDFLKEPEVLHVNAGHFTQVVWVNSREIGLGKARSRTGKEYVVAHYRPAGNVIGQFQHNVFPAIGEREDGEQECSVSSPSSPRSSHGERGGGGGGGSGGSGGGGGGGGAGGSGGGSGGSGGCASS